VLFRSPPESLSIIGSNSIDTAGELYVIDLNNIAKPENKRKKRLFDLASAGLLFVLFPLVMLFQKKPLQFIINALKVILGMNTWVGYGKTIRKDLPAIKPSILTPADAVTGEVNKEKFNVLLLNYSKANKAENDLKIVFKDFRNLGN
jgi:hypothetical protein